VKAFPRYRRRRVPGPRRWIINSQIFEKVHCQDDDDSSDTTKQNRSGWADPSSRDR
jgi:hypothetical protein